MSAPDFTENDPKLGPLPVWDLSALYASPDDPKITQDFEWSTSEAEAFSARWKGRLETITATELQGAIEVYEAIDERLSRIMSYAGLRHAGDLTDADRGRFMQDSQEKAIGITANLVFFELELNNLAEDKITALQADPALGTYSVWLGQLARWRPYQLSEDMEKLLQEKSSTGSGAWNRLFDETMAEMRFPMDGKELTSAEVLNMLSSTDRAKRKAAGESIGATLGANNRLFAQITNTLAKDKVIEDKWRGYAKPISSRNLANEVEDEVVEALITAVRDAYPDLSHRYYALKAKWFGSDKLDYYDRNAPLPDSDNRMIPWPQAQSTVLEAYGEFSPKLAEVARPFFSNGWIDAPARAGKSPGAFAHPTVPSAHPYLLLNYQGKTRDVMTLAHELGHGVHQRLAAEQGHFLAQTPLTLAETASVFGEMLTFQKLLRETTDAKTRRALLASKTEDMLNTVVRQISMLEFERAVHNERREGEIAVERLGEIWMETQRESLGPALNFDEGYQWFWSYVPHFIHSPFYVYAYAFGDCLVNALYAVYHEGEEGFADRYLEMLSAGGSKHHSELLAPFGLNATDPGFWKRGLDMIAGFVTELDDMDG
jgi:oligoendopeptidase F